MVENLRMKLPELRKFIHIKTPPQRLADAEAYGQITRECAAGDSLIKF
jgi:hypothetical protein